MILRLQALVAVAAVALTVKSLSVGAFTVPTTTTRSRTQNRPSFQLASSAPSDDAAFSSFAASLEQDSDQASKSNNNNNNNIQPVSTWKNDLDEILNPTTAQARRQILVSQLLTANAEIRASVEAALRDRKVRFSWIWI
jgi:hypothetical protein